VGRVKRRRFDDPMDKGVYIEPCEYHRKKLGTVAEAYTPPDQMLKRRQRECERSGQCITCAEDAAPATDLKTRWLGG
jgi:hypothetical protein